MPTIKFVNAAEAVDKTVVTVGGANLRIKAIEAGVDVYKLMGKLTNCGGIGQCGTCVVEVLSGMEQLSPRTAFEERKLKRKPESYRLACQTLVGDGPGEGNIEVRTKPDGKMQAQPSAQPSAQA